MWSIAHEQGIRLPSKDYWEFEDMITMTPSERNADVEEMTNNFFLFTQLIQSSPQAIEQSVHSIIGGGYRKCNLVLQELRFNPMRRNRVGERDLDHIILSALWGMKRALLEYPQVQAGLIMEMDRTFTLEQNTIILEKAIKYMHEGIVGIDLSGPQRDTFSLAAHQELFSKARSAGLGVTIHTGEEGDPSEMQFIVGTIKPDRIGHGILAASNPALLASLVKSKIVLELCPTSNLKNSIIPDVATLHTIYRTLIDAGVPLTINTDGPEMYRTNVVKEEVFLLNEGVMSEDEIAQCRDNAFNATFVRN
jgi:adenosine deaminase